MATLDEADTWVQRVCCSIQLPIISPSIAMWVISVLILLLAGDVHVNPGPIKSRCKSLSMCHANVRSLSRSKLLAVKTSLANLYDIITLSETHLHQGIGDDLFI